MTVLTDAEIRETASRLNNVRDRDPDSSRAMLLGINDQHGRGIVRAVIEEMERQAQVRYTEAMAVFANLPPMTFAEALRIKRERHDPCAEGWTKIGDTFSKLTRCG